VSGKWKEKVEKNVKRKFIWKYWDDHIRNEKENGKENVI